MKLKIKLLTMLAVAMLAAANTNAASMTINGPADVSVGDSIELQIFGDFSNEGLIAGGITFSWNSDLVQLDNITRAFGAADFSCPGSPGCPPNGTDSAPIVWGEFLSDLIPVGAGSTLMATLTFTANATGAAGFGMADNLALTGGWFGATFSPIDSPTFGGHTTNINPVPLPAAAWLFGSALLGLVGVAKRKKA